MLTVQCFMNEIFVLNVPMLEPRPNVGIVLVNKDKQVFVGRRVCKKNQPEDLFWQMPQGGVDGEEDPEAAAKRELCEEVGVNPDQIEVIAVSKNWYTYDIPPEMQTRHFYAQTQKWFLVQYKGTDEEININTEIPEFCEWKWVDYKKVGKQVIDFKKDVYKQVFKDFGWYFDDNED